MREDDPNDVVPHEHRRELRAARLIAAWLGRFDTREQNSLDVLVEERGRRFVRHYELDFGDSFGGEWQGQDRLNERVGDAYYWDLGQILVDLLSLGLVPRPFHHPKPRPGGATFGYYGSAGFSPTDWKPLTPHPAFTRMTWRDALWMVRAMVKLSDAHLSAIVREARFSDPRNERYLLRVLIERRDRIAAAYLLPRCALAGVRLEPGGQPGGRQALCFEDLSIRHAGVDARQVRYTARLLGGARLERELGRADLAPGDSEAGITCVELPLAGRRPAELAPRGAAEDHPLRYAVLELTTWRSGLPVGSLRAHFYDLGEERGLVLVGLERSD